MPTPVEKSLERMLDFSAMKQKVLNKNIANIGTEGYNRQDVKFNDVLSESLSAGLKKTNEKHLPPSDGESAAGIEIIEDPDKEMYSGVNNVNIDAEMAEMAENTLKFKFASKKIAAYYKNLQGVIKGA